MTTMVNVGACLCCGPTHDGCLPAAAVHEKDVRRRMRAHFKEIHPSFMAAIITGKSLPRVALNTPLAVHLPTPRHLLLETERELRKEFFTPLSVKRFDGQPMRSFALGCYKPLPAILNPLIA